MKATPEIRWADAKTVRMAETIRRRWHGELQGARIGYVLMPKLRACMAQTWKTCALDAFLSGLDFVIEINAPDWREMSNACRRALLDHELTHCRPGRNGRWASRHRHDLEEFAAVVTRHGSAVVFDANGGTQ